MTPGNQRRSASSATRAATLREGDRPRSYVQVVHGEPYYVRPSQLASVSFAATAIMREDHTSYAAVPARPEPGYHFPAPDHYDIIGIGLGLTAAGLGLYMAGRGLRVSYRPVVGFLRTL